MQRGIKIELCYAAALGGGDVAARRNVIQNAVAIIRATRGRGVIISSEAKDALSVRAPWDAINLAAVWGLGQERGREAVDKECRYCVRAAELRRDSFRGAIRVVGGLSERSKDAKALEEGSDGKLGTTKTDKDNVKVEKKTDGSTLDEPSDTGATKNNKRKAETAPQTSPDGQPPLSKRAQKRLAKEQRDRQAKPP